MEYKEKAILAGEITLYSAWRWDLRDKMEESCVTYVLSENRNLQI